MRIWPILDDRAQSYNMKEEGWQKFNILNDMQTNTTITSSPPSKLDRLKYNPGLDNGLGYQTVKTESNMAQSIPSFFLSDIKEKRTV